MKDDFLEKLEAVLERDPRFGKGAYLFVFDALEYTVEKLGKASLPTTEERHISGRDLLQGISEYSLDQYGPLTRAVFAHWGLKCTRDFGEIVFNLVEAGLMSKTDRDAVEDFDEVYDFDEEFDWKRRRPDVKRMAR